MARLVVLPAVAALLAGCRLDVVTAIDVRADGSGSIAIELTADAELTADLERLGVPPASDLVAAVGEVDGWDAQEQRTDDGGARVGLYHEAATPSELSGVLRELARGLADDDPALLVEVDLDVAADGAARLEGIAGLRPPATSGASIDGVPVGPAGEELAALVEATVTPTLVVSLPGPVLAHDADRVEGRTLSWDLPVGQTRPVSARSGPPTAAAVVDLPWLVAGVALATVVLGWLVVRTRRRRRARQR